MPLASHRRSVSVPTVFELPALFPSVGHYLLALLILISGQLIYATVGFGAGMFAITLLVLLLDDLHGVVMMMLLLTWTTEVLVLSREWRNARGLLLVWMVPAMVVGVYFGNNVLKSGDGEQLKLLLGVVVAAAGLWFLYQDYQRRRASDEDHKQQVTTISTLRAAIATPMCFASGFLGALFGTGGPPVIIYLKTFHMPKMNFRATILTFFMSMSVARMWIAIGSDNLTWVDVHTAVWMIPASVAGTILGAKVYSRLSEQVFASIVSVMIFLLGLILIATNL